MREFRKPDLNAPRYRAQRVNILNANFYKAFRETHPKYSHLSDKDIKSIVHEVNGKIWNTVIEDRDGVELPEQLGYIFIGSCPAPKKENPNYHVSKELQKVIQHRNWESDQHLAKIIYTNSASKYRFQFSNLWGFKPVRQFSRTVGQTYPENYTKYLVLDDYRKMNDMFRRRIYEMKTKNINQEVLNTEYNEFDLE
jgi:hypothetical protein